ncbi:DAK2 domain-containing protein [Schaalia sp. 19OD2882]|uniref:DAK2 domain-containing protein n=1 Tax=Schaalia sp. 19OD2882 TaxID=2794089 RepID=UPI001C1EFC18|nr:DAK2 domain-containing protein [Schaalia sp. 19OD2882]QWW18910.1 DAK2 domain-containing protein [Schaalia sp. 19OD2882]
MGDEFVPLDAPTMIRAVRTCADELSRLAAFIDDLDGWGRGDCDTGANALLTLRAMAEECEAAPAPTVQGVLEAAVDAGVRRGSGHVGVLLTQLMAAWADGLEGADTDAYADSPSALTPLAVRRMLTGSSTLASETGPWAAPVIAVLTEAASELESLGPTVFDVHEVVTTFNTQAQCGLVEATHSATGRIDAGAAVLVCFAACLDAATRKDSEMLEVLAQMLADLANRDDKPAPRGASPRPGRDFTVDILLQGMDEDVRALTATLDAVGAHWSLVGRADFFGMGTWRIHVDTSAPLAVRPRRGRTLRFQVSDARPDEAIGEDALSDGVTHRGIRLLERRARTRIHRATVAACTRAPGLVEDFARSGAVVLLDPTPEDRDALVTVAESSSTGVALFIPCDEASARLAAAASARLAERDIDALVATCRDELSVLVLVRACAPVFVPQPGGPAVAPLVRTVLSEASAHALAGSRVVEIAPGPPEVTVPGAMEELRDGQIRTLRLLLARDSDELLDPVARQVLASSEGWSQWVNLEVLDGMGPGAGLLQGLR